MSKLWWLPLALFVIGTLLTETDSQAQIFGSGSRPFRTSVQRNETVTIASLYQAIVDLNLLKVRVDSLEAALERAHVVTVLDSTRYPTGTSTHLVETDSSGLLVITSSKPDSIWLCFTRYEISFEPDPTREEQ